MHQETKIKGKISLQETIMLAIISCRIRNVFEEPQLSLGVGR